MAELLFKDEVYTIVDKIIVELKAIDHLTSREEAQLLNYLKSTGMPVGLLINFGADRDLEWKPMILTPQKPIRAPKALTLQQLPRINDPKPIRED
ncbi:MAG: GxxExxY protein [Chloroflexi bacterium]|nr:GxxExxY protein [Chloroflexota bacterium]